MRERPILFVAGVVVGLLLLGGLRFAFLPEEAQTHYHANWAVFIEGQRLDLTAERYMEDVVRCAVDPDLVAPEDRVHMHSNNHDVVHVHHPGATWGHFLANLGFGIGEDYLITDEGQRYVETPEKSLKFILNGQEMTSIRNQLIESEDRLLISYGSEPADEVAQSQLPRVAENAGEYNLMPDPATCSGNTPAGWQDRLRRAFWF